MGEFGDKFRKAREKKDISLDDVSNVTKISSRMLQAIEQEHFDQLPGGVFNKGFIRAYAKHLGLNDEEAITDYLACLRQAQIDAHEVWEPERPRNGTPPARPAVQEKHRPVESTPAPVKSQPAPPVEDLPDLQLPRAEHMRPGRKDFAQNSTREIPWRILAIAAVVIVLGIILWTRRSHNANTATADTVQAKNAPLPASTPPPPNQPSQAPLSSQSATSEHSSVPTSQPPTHPLASPVPSPAADAKNTDSNNHEKNDVIVRTFPTTKPLTNPKPNPNPSDTTAAALTLVIRATETSWISALADGQTVSHETLIAPAHTSVRANREIVVKIGNAAGVTFLWNGQEIPADGAEAEVKIFVFDANGMRVLPATQAPTQNQ